MTDSGAPIDVGQTILEWSGTLPMWQRDALRRIVTSVDLSNADENEIYGIARGEYGLESVVPAVAPVPLAAEHLPAPAARNDSLALLSIHGVAHVNALESEQELLLGSAGLSIVYGENATGKSGYSRVLKRACRARDAEPILPNVLEASEDVAVAQFDVVVGGEKSTVTWRDQEVLPDVLSAVAVFDSATARVFVDDENEIRFLPYGLDAFPRLAALCGRLKLRLADELQRSQQSLHAPSLSGDTEAARLMAALDADCCPADAAVLAYLSPGELKEMVELRTARLQDPVLRARTLRSQAERLRALSKRVEPLVTAVSREAVVELKRLATAAKDSSEAARLASGEEFGSEPLSGVGSEAWRIMYEAARGYSEKHAYPESRFPVTTDGAFCVLCQQSLLPDGADRMCRFENFVANETAKRAASDALALQQKVKLLKDAETKPEEHDNPLLEDLSARAPALRNRLVDELEALRHARGQCLEAVSSGDWAKTVPAIAETPRALVRLAEELEGDALKADGSADLHEQERISARLAELDARQALSREIPAIAATIARKRGERDLGLCAQSANTQGITRKGGELYKAAVTDALEAELQKELTALGVGHLPLHITDRGATGKRLHRISLSGAVRPAATLSRVLSEGERRAVAIAAMLAECGLQGVGFPVVLDDPVCSLDHKYRERVATRLVEESRQRQVIVLTHDVFFLAELEEQARTQKLPVDTTVLRRVGGRVGLCEAGKPWRTMSVKERLDWCDRRASGLRAIYDSGDEDEYEEQAGIVADRLRNALEEMVEESVFNRVVTRFQNNVAVLRLDRVVFVDDDYDALMTSYGRLSAWTPAHAEGAGAMRETPTPDALRSEVEVLRTFLKELQTRQNAAANDRKS